MSIQLVGKPIRYCGRPFGTFSSVPPAALKRHWLTTYDTEFIIQLKLHLLTGII